MTEEKTIPAISVVVIGRNEGERLRRCLASVRAANVRVGDVELIYVDANSSDDSLTVAREAGATRIALRDNRPTAALARDTGWRHASAPLILFLDGDCTLHPDFIENVLPAFDDDSVAAVFCRIRERDPSVNIFHRAFDLHWWHPDPGPVESSAGTALYRRAALERVNGYDTELMTVEEPELCHRVRRLGYQILCVRLPMVAHDVSMTNWTQYWRRGARMGYGYAEVAARVPRADLPAIHRKAARGRLWAPLMLGLPVVAASASISSGSWIPLALLFAAAAVLVLPIALGARRRTPSFYSCLVYGVHWYLKELPQAIGQLRYLYDKLTGQHSFIEYKFPTVFSPGKKAD